MNGKIVYTGEWSKTTLTYLPTWLSFSPASPTSLWLLRILDHGNLSSRVPRKKGHQYNVDISSTLVQRVTSTTSGLEATPSFHKFTVQERRKYAAFRHPHSQQSPRSKKCSYESGHDRDPRNRSGVEEEHRTVSRRGDSREDERNASRDIPQYGEGYL
jgi:hypothetical protein